MWCGVALKPLLTTSILIAGIVCLSAILSAQGRPEAVYHAPKIALYAVVDPAVIAPRAIYAPKPGYSEEARKAKYAATCTLWLIVGKDGFPREIRIYRAAGMGLDEKALAAMQKWRFEPASKNGHPIAVQVIVDVAFPPD